MEQTALYSALEAADWDRAGRLLAEGGGVDLSPISRAGETFLHVAVRRGCDGELLRKLLPGVALHQRDADSRTAFDVAVAVGNLEQAAVISDYVLGLVLAGDVDSVRRLAVGGWDTWPLKGVREIDDHPELMGYLSGSKMPTERTRQLHEAVMSGDGSQVLNLLNDGMTSCCADPAGLTALHKAVLYEQNELAQVLQKGALNATDNMGRTALHYAAGLQDSTLYTMLQSVNADAKITDKLGNTAAHYKTAPLALEPIQQLSELLLRLPRLQRLLRELHQSIADDNPAAFKEQLERKRYVSLRDASGLTVMHKAVMYGRVGIVRWMVDNFKDAVSVTDHWGRVPAHYAAGLQDTEIKQILQDAGSNDNVKDDAGETPASLQVDLTAAIDNADFLGRLSDFQQKVSDAHCSLVDGKDLGVLKQLVDRRALVDAADRTGLTLLHKAVLLDRPEVVTYLACNFPRALDATDNLGRTALHLAAGMHDTTMRDELQKAGAKPTTDLLGNVPDVYGKQPQALQLDVLKKRAAGHSNIASVMPRPEPATPATRQNTLLAESSKPVASQQQEIPRRPTPKPMEDPFPLKNVAYPTTPDAGFLGRVVGPALVRALAEVVQQKPSDPIEYIAQYLYKYRSNCDHALQEIALAAEIEQEQQRDEKEQQRIMKLKEEQMATTERSQQLEAVPADTDTNIRELDEHETK